MKDKIIMALENNFKKQVELSSGVTFKETKVSLPSRLIWENYADAVLEVINEKS